MEEEKNIVVEDGDKKIVQEFDFITPSCFSSSSMGSENSNAISPVSCSFCSSSAEQVEYDPLSDMSTLLQQLPIKRGLSKYYQGKSQSFTSLAKVNSLEDLAKAENPYNKKLKSCKSYGEEMGEDQNACTTKRELGLGLHSNTSRGSCAKRPPIPSSPHRSTTSNTIPNQTVLLV